MGSIHSWDISPQPSIACRTPFVKIKNPYLSRALQGLNNMSERGSSAEKSSSLPTTLQKVLLRGPQTSMRRSQSPGNHTVQSEERDETHHRYTMSNNTAFLPPAAISQGRTPELRPANFSLPPPAYSRDFFDSWDTRQVQQRALTVDPSIHRIPRLHTVLEPSIPLPSIFRSYSDNPHSPDREDGLNEPATTHAAGPSVRRGSPPYSMSGRSVHSGRCVLGEDSRYTSEPDEIQYAPAGRNVAGPSRAHGPYHTIPSSSTVHGAVRTPSNPEYHTSPVDRTLSFTAHLPFSHTPDPNRLASTRPYANLPGTFIPLTGSRSGSHSDGEFSEGLNESNFGVLAPQGERVGGSLSYIHQSEQLGRFSGSEAGHQPRAGTYEDEQDAERHRAPDQSSDLGSRDTFRHLAPGHGQRPILHRQTTPGSLSPHGTDVSASRSLPSRSLTAPGRAPFYADRSLPGELAPRDISAWKDFEDNGEEYRNQARAFARRIIEDGRIKKPYQKTVVACTFCRRRKLRCDGDKPCQKCIKRDQPCEYTDFVKRRGPGKAPKGTKSKKAGKAPAASSSSSHLHPPPLYEEIEGLQSPIKPAKRKRRTPPRIVIDPSLENPFAYKGKPGVRRRHSETSEDVEQRSPGRKRMRSKDETDPGEYDYDDEGDNDDDNDDEDNPPPYSSF